MVGKHAIRRYPFLTIANFRDLGGYMGTGPGVTQWRVFFRSARLTHATQRELDELIGLGIRTVIDLRMQEEVGRQPDACIGMPGIAYHHLSLIGDYIDARAAAWMQGEVPVMSTLYQEILTQGPERFRDLFNLMADAVAQGGVLFHCTAGKDRTGLVAMLLQSICGVDRLDILADYEVSFTYNQHFLPDDTTGSDPAHMAAALDFLDKTYGGPVQYLQAAGVSEDTLARIRARFLMPSEVMQQEDTKS